MIRKASDCKVEYKEHMRGGDGTVKLTSFIGSDADLNGKGRLFSKITLEPGCGIGFHIRLPCNVRRSSYNNKERIERGG